MITKLQLELARATKQPTRATESADTPSSDCENPRFEKRVAEDLQRMKRAMMTAPVLFHYGTYRKRRMETDASEGVLSGVLSQQMDSKWHPIALHIFERQ
ncbi:hypothetical protein E4U39_007510 [Claviceps sp. Clav50 group G5]|nr:hypothetical protein E4U39_007510 [Claviceps sp. Clav50 group G5]